MSASFADLGVPAAIARSLSARGISSPFPIQELALPAALAGRDVCGRAPTGSGKTIAFGIPLAARATGGRPRRPVALVLAPTRELAAQIESEIALLFGAKGNQRVAAFYGGVGFGAQLAALRRGVDVAVACPGRLKDLIERGACDLSEVSMVVIDEADRMADMGFLPEVRRLLDQVRPDRQTLLFSATLDGEVDTLVRRYQNSPAVVSIEAKEDDDHPASEHHFLPTANDQRIRQAAELIKRHGSTVVFCRTKHGTDRVAKQLALAGVKAVPIHGGRSQSQRERALATFAAGRVEALVATDVAARGIHVDDVACVVHFDIAGSFKDYLHRSGRTGRAGSAGVVVSLVTPDTAGAAGDLQRELAGERPANGSPNGSGTGRPSRRSPAPPRRNPRTGSQNPATGSQNPGTGSQNSATGSQNPRTGRRNPATAGRRNPAAPGRPGGGSSDGRDGRQRRPFRAA